MKTPTAVPSASGSSRPSRRRLAVLVVLLVAVVVLGRLFGEPPRILEDEMAAGFADHTLLGAISGVSNAPDGLAETVEALETDSIGGLTNESPFGWKLIGEDGGRLVVATYFLWDNGGWRLIPRASAWGRACRSYDLGEHPVSAEPIVCPPGAPENPRF